MQVVKPSAYQLSQLRRPVCIVHEQRPFKTLTTSVNSISPDKLSSATKQPLSSEPQFHASSQDGLKEQLEQLRSEEEAVRARREQIEFQLFRIQQEDAKRAAMSNQPVASGSLASTGPGVPRKRTLKPKSKRMAAMAAAAGVLRVNNSTGNGSSGSARGSQGHTSNGNGLASGTSSYSSRSSPEVSNRQFQQTFSDHNGLETHSSLQQDQEPLEDTDDTESSASACRAGSANSIDGMCVVPKPIFIISDCTGESAARTVRAALNQFELCFKTSAPATLLVFRFLDDEKKAYQIIETASKEDALVVYTLVNPKTLAAVQTACKLYNVRNVDLWGNLLDCMEAHLDATRSGVPMGVGMEDTGRRRLSEDYFKMIEAVEYTRKMDDGANPKEWKSADLLILGVSRCGKTPLSIFLGQRGYKVANLPLVTGLPPPKELYEMDQTRIVGLTIDPQVRFDRWLYGNGDIYGNGHTISAAMAGEGHVGWFDKAVAFEVLLSIRRNRLGMMGVRDFGVPIDYAEIQKINAELAWARSLYAANPDWPVLDVTLRGVEETAARILKILNDKRGDASPQWVEELYGKMSRRAAAPLPQLSPTITRLSPALEEMYIGGEQYLVEGLY